MKANRGFPSVAHRPRRTTHALVVRVGASRLGCDAFRVIIFGECDSKRDLDLFQCYDLVSYARVAVFQVLKILLLIAISVLIASKFAAFISS